MNLTLLEHWPNWAIFVIFPAASLTIMFAFTAAFRLAVKRSRFFEFDAETVNTTIQNTISGAYVVLGFVLVLVMSTANEIDDNNTKEASYIESLDRLLVMEGSTAAKNARQSLHAYTASIVNVDWDRLVDGIYRPETRALANMLFNHINAIQINNNRQQAIFSEIIQTQNKIIEYRNLRILSSQSQLPTLFWTLSFLTLLGIILVSAFQLTDASRKRAAALSLQLTILSWLFAVVMILDLPFVGEHKISPVAFERALHLMQLNSQAD